MAVNLDEVVELDGVPTAIRDLPREIAVMFGYGHPHLPGEEWRHQAHSGDYPYTTDTCLLADEPGTNTWLDNGEFLACNGCGFNGT